MKIDLIVDEMSIIIHKTTIKVSHTADSVRLAPGPGC